MTDREKIVELERDRDKWKARAVELLHAAEDASRERGKREEAEANLAGALGALGELNKAARDPEEMDCVYNCVPAAARGEKDMCEYWPCSHVRLLAAADAAAKVLDQHTTPAAERLLAIRRAAEVTAEEHRKDVYMRNMNRSTKGYTEGPCACGICKAVREEA